MKKKISLQKRRVLENVAYRRYKRRFYRKGKSQNSSIRIPFIYENQDKIFIKSPKIIDIYNTDHASEFLSYIEEAEKHRSPENKKQIILPFSQTSEITLSGGIILKAFYDKLKFDGYNVKIKIPETNRKTRQILKHTGIIDNESIKITYEDISRWKIRSWKKEDRENSNATQELKSILIELTKWNSDNDDFQSILTALVEAIWNSFEHAYYEVEPEEFQHTYLFSGMHGDNYTFCIFDRGIGFKGSFQKYHPSLFNQMQTESGYIQKALKYGRSDAEGAGRGSGLPDVIDNISKLEGTVSIYSNKAFYEKRDTKPKETERRADLHGSLVQITIPLKKI